MDPNSATLSQFFQIKLLRMDLEQLAPLKSVMLWHAFPYGPSKYFSFRFRWAESVGMGDFLKLPFAQDLACSSAPLRAAAGSRLTGVSLEPLGRLLFHRLPTPREKLRWTEQSLSERRRIV